jgi:hypothetical protein
MSKLRTAVPIVLIAIGLFGVVAAIYADSSDWRAIWIGVASTGLSAGLVDGSAVLEARRREQVILRIAGQRVGRIHQRLLWIVQALFEVSMAEAAALPRLLRELDQGEINLTVTRAEPHPTENQGGMGRPVRRRDRCGVGSRSELGRPDVRGRAVGAT